MPTEREDDMSAFTVEFQNRSGELARLCEAMAAHGVNIVVCGAAHGDTGTVAFIADDERGARDALEGADIEYNERPALTIRMENVAGAGAKAFRKLADAGVNIDLFLPVRVSAEEFLAHLCRESRCGCPCARRSGSQRLRGVQPWYGPPAIKSQAGLRSGASSGFAEDREKTDKQPPMGRL